MHEYVEFSGISYVETNKPILTRFGSGGFISRHSFAVPAKIQIPIREMVEIILPKLNEHSCCQKEHLLKPDGKPNYTYYGSAIKYYDYQTKQYMIALREDDSADYVYMSESVFNKFYKDVEN